MKTKIPVLTFLFFALTFLYSCESNECIKGEGDIVTRTLDIKDFTGINLKINADVSVSQGENQEIKVTGNANIIDIIKTAVSNNVWNIELEESCSDYQELSFEITIPDLSSVKISGTGHVSINDFENTGDINLGVLGTGVFDVYALNGTENMTIDIEGAGKVTGRKDFSSLKSLIINISGTANVHGYSFQTENCTVNVSGTSNCYVNVSEKLDVKISGTANIYYKGHPTVVSDISGTGNIIDDND